MVTLNFLFIGFACDFFLIPQYVQTYNEQTAPILRDRRVPRSSCCGCRWHCGVLLASMVALGFNYVFMIDGPNTLERFGFLDIHGQLAGTTENPFDLVGIPRDTNAKDISQAYRSPAARAARQKLEEAPHCDEQCKPRRKKMQQKAVEYFKKMQAQREEEIKKAKKKGHNEDTDAKIDRWLDRWKAVFLKIQAHASPYFGGKSSEEQEQQSHDEL